MGEVLRLNGVIQDVAAGRVIVGVEEAFIHCARAILRSRLWAAPPTDSHRVVAPDEEATMAPLRQPAVVRLLASSPFLFVSSWDVTGASDTSPRGDEQGFLRILDEQTLALPDRKGNQRTDTFHNIVSSRQISLVALIPGSDQLVHLSGQASITNEPSLLATMALQGKPPQAALLLTVQEASISHSQALAEAQIWRPSAHVDPQRVPDMMALALQHLAVNKPTGLLGTISRLLGSSPTLVRALMKVGYRSQLKAEGYTPAVPNTPAPVRQPSLVRLIGSLPGSLRQPTQHVLRGLASHLTRTVNALDGLFPSQLDRLAGSPVRQVRVVAVKRETLTAVTLVLEDLTGQLFEFKPGQFFTLMLLIDGQPVMRSYSASNAPGTTQLAVTIKQVGNGLVSTYINQRLKPGDQLGLGGPSGRFCVTPDPVQAREYVLLGSGSGITPLMSIAQTVLATEPQCRVSVLYSNRRWEDVIFAQAWEELSQRYAARLRVRHLLSAPHLGWIGGFGRLDEATARQEVLDLGPGPQAQFYVCGPEPMMQGVNVALLSLGVAAERVHMEAFNPTRPPIATLATDLPTAHPLRVRQAGQDLAELVVPAGQTLLQAGLDAQLPLPFSCGMGGCGECRVKLIEGKVTMAEPNCLSTAERQQGYILSCVARPNTDVIIDLS